MITFSNLGAYGRMGNQMFQYATLYSIAKTKKYDFGIPFKLKTNNPYFNMCLDQAFPNLSAKDCTGIQPARQAREKVFTYNAGIFGILDNTDIVGYFQSEKYFKDYREDLLKEFQFKEEIKQKASDIRNISNKKAISVHIRLGDYENLQGKHPICSVEYYIEAFKRLPDDCFVYIFSDDTKKAFEIFKFLNKSFLMPETKDQFVDMCLMTMCDYHIIANSSFSWWGAWLSNSKQVIAPSEWFGTDPSMPKNWSDIYCKDWKVI
jgi:hypothetical protein